MTLCLQKDFKKYENTIPIALQDNRFVGITFDDKAPVVTEMSGDFDPIGYLDVKNNQRSSVFIAGPSGSGKSTIARKIAEGHRKRLRERNRYCVFTSSYIRKRSSFQRYDKLFTN